jgi:hypothetical protein
MWGLPAETWEFSLALFEQLTCQQKRSPNPLIIKWFHCAELGMIDPRYGIFSLPRWRLVAALSVRSMPPMIASYLTLAVSSRSSRMLCALCGQRLLTAKSAKDRQGREEMLSLI